MNCQESEPRTASITNLQLDTRRTMKIFCQATNLLEEVSKKKKRKKEAMILSLFYRWNLKIQTIKQTIFFHLKTKLKLEAES